MCRSSVRNVFDVVTLRVVLMAIAVVPTTAASQSEDIYSKPDTLFIKPDKTSEKFWLPGARHQRFNDPPRGYREILGIPWALFRPLPLGMLEETKQLPSQTPYAYPNMNSGMMNEDFAGYARRSVNEMSPAEKEYQAVRRALARDRAQPMRRSMIPAARTMPKITNKRNEKTIEDLSPLMITLASLIDKLDSPNGEVKLKTEDGSGRAKHRVTGLLRGIIGELQRALEKRVNQVSNKSKKAKIKSKENAFGDSFDSPVGSEETSKSEDENYPQYHSSTIGFTVNKRRNKSMGVIDSPDNSPVIKDSKDEMKFVSPLQKVENNRNHTRSGTQNDAGFPMVATVQELNSAKMGGKPSFRTRIDHSAVPSSRLLAQNSSIKSSSESLENSTGFLPEYRAFKTVEVTKKPVNEDPDTSVELVNRAFVDVKPVTKMENVSSKI